MKRDYYGRYVDDDDERSTSEEPDGYDAWGMERPEPGEDDPFEDWGND